MASTSLNNPNANFIGFITRKDEDTGVSLIAKIVTPSKKLSMEKLVKVKINANALDDYACCVIDHAAMKKKIEGSQDLDAVSNSFQFSSYGVHGTSIKYSITGDGGSANIGDYIDLTDGTLKGHPKYNGTEGSDVSGAITITVTKNKAKVSSRIPFRIKGMSANDVLTNKEIYEDATSLEAYLWDKIKGKNGQYLESDAADGYKSGHQSIKSKLLFNNMQQIPLKEGGVFTGLGKISNKPVTCEWNVILDGVAEGMQDVGGFEGIYTFNNNNTTYHSRICMTKTDENYGNVYRPDYAKICESKFNPRADDIDYMGYATLISDDEQAKNRYFRLGKPDKNDEKHHLHLRATLTLGDAKREVDYYCATLSHYMTSSEVATFIRNTARFAFTESNKIDSTAWLEFDSSTSSNSFVEIQVPQMPTSDPNSGYDTVPDSAKDQYIHICGTGYFRTLSENEYKTLCIDPNTLMNILKITGNLYKVNNVSGTLTATDSFYSKTKLLFTPHEFRSESLGDNEVGDYNKYIKLPIGDFTASGQKNGLYEADRILDENEEENIYFSLGLKVNVDPIGEKITSDPTSASTSLNKLFKLTRLESQPQS